MGLQLQVTNSPFTSEQAELINKLLPTLTDTQINWLSGYISGYRTISSGGSTSGIATNDAVSIPATTTTTTATSVVPQVPREATILFGSQTGNAQRLAGRLAESLKAEGFEVTLSAMNKYKVNNLKKTAYLFILVSTHGEGDPPDNALTFHEYLHSKRAPRLEGTKFSVLALGDTSYEYFCKTGQDFDSQLAQLGATRLTDRVDCDVDYEESAAAWLASVLQAVNHASTASVAAVSSAGSSASGLAAGESEYSRNHPFMAEVLDTLNLNGRGSDRETRHLELSLEGSGLSYAPGDALGVYPQNDPSLVDELISFLQWDPTTLIVTGKKGETSSLREALLHHYEITVLTKPLLEKATAFSGSSKLAELLKPEHKDGLKAYIKGRDLLDLLRDHTPWTLTPADVPALLRKLPPRLYSIASSLHAHPEEVHLTIRKVEYEAHGRERKGVCSVYTSERLQPGDKLPIFVQHNPNFKLPLQSDTPIIMVGPGTGVAPFRAFLEEREELGADGKTWLFYGDRHFVTDFLYQTDWQRMLQDGVLTKLDVAFSRDTDEKVYVQHRMLEHGEELYQWLQHGAHVYVCGDEKYMAHDVHNALVSIIEQYGGLSAEQAVAYLSELQEQGRYQRDVY